MAFPSRSPSVQTNGTWGPAQVDPGINGQESEQPRDVDPAAGTCAADGFIVTGELVQPFTVAQANGTWARRPSFLA